MTARTRGRRRHEDRLNPLGGREAPSTQIDVRVDAETAAALTFPLESNTWTGWQGREVLWLGPNEWLVVSHPDSREPGRIISELETLLAGTHYSVVDVSAARALIELGRPDRHELLAHGCGLDLHPQSWREGMCAQTVLARVSVVLQERRDDTRLFIRPSYVGYIVDWLVDAGRSHVTFADTPALQALVSVGLRFEVVRTQRARSAEESASFQGIELGQLLRTIVVRRGANDYVFVLVPGGREIDWKKLRAHLGVSRLSLPDADEAKDATGYERGTITPFGSTNAWPVIADATIPSIGTVAIGGGGHGINIHVTSKLLVKALKADVADVTKVDEHSVG